MLNIGDPRAWLSDGGYTHDAGTPGSVYTGTANFSGPGVQGNVPFAFAPVSFGMERETTRPVYEAFTAGTRTALPGLAKRARAGDQSAMMGYQYAYTQLQDDDRAYEIARGHNLNDVNATDLVRMVRDAGSNPALGTGSAQYKDNLADYLAQQAIQRGAHVRELGVSEQMLDDTFQTSFMAALSSGAGVSPLAGGLKDRFASSPGMLMNSSLFLRKGLAAWEQKNGLRSDAMRANILTKAAEYYARSMSVDGLNRFTNDASTIIQAAAEAAGAVSGVVNENVFDAYQNAVGSLDNIISYSGATDADISAGDAREDGGARTAAVRGIKTAYADVIARNLAAGRGAWDFDDETSAQLTRNLETAIDHIAPAARAFDNYGVVRNDLVGRIKKMGEAGSIDIANLFDVYTSPDEETFTAPRAMPGADVFGAVADQAITDLVQNRSYFRTNLKDYLEPEYTTEGIDKYLDVLLGKMEGVAPDAKTAMKSMIADYIYSINTKTDSINVDSEELKGYREGLQDRVKALAASMQLYEAGIIDAPVVPGTAPGSRDGSTLWAFGRQTELMSGYRSSARNAYGPLLENVERFLDGRTAERLTNPEDIYRFYLASSIAQGIRNTIDGSYTGDNLIKKAKATVAKASGNRMLNEGLAGAYATAEGLTRAHLKGRLPDADADGRQRTLNTIVNSMMSDATDPVFARRAREYTASKLSQIGGKYFSRETLAAYVNRYAPAVLQLMRRSMDGMTSDVWKNPGSFDDYMDRLSKPLFEKVTEHATILRTMAEQDYARRLATKERMS